MLICIWILAVILIVLIKKSFSTTNMAIVACCVGIILIDKIFLTTAIAMISHKQREAGKFKRKYVRPCHKGFTYFPRMNFSCIFHNDHIFTSYHCLTFFLLPIFARVLLESNMLLQVCLLFLGITQELHHITKFQ